MPSRLMQSVMLLAPHLATQTYACPHMIAANAVVGVAHGVRKVMPPIRNPVAPPPGAEIAFSPTTLPRTPPKLLVHTKDAWRSVESLTPELVDAEISDSRLETVPTANGGIEWQVEAPITFSYKVREETDILDPESDALIFGHISDAATLAKAKARPLKRVVVVDEAVHSLYGERIEAYFEAHNVKMKLLVLPTTEENKNMDLVLTIAEAIHDLGIDRRLDPVIAIGGGVCMDIVGFAASIYRRKTPYIRVPTTLMGYVDASIGAKSGVNFYTPTDGWRKNKLGSYMPPVLTLLDRSFLATLDQRQLSNGAAEIAKMALVKDPELYELLVEHGDQLIDNKFQDVIRIEDALGLGSYDHDGEHQQLFGSTSPASTAPSRVLYLAIQTMLEELAPNLWESSLNRLVDFGHVFSMELEMAALYDEKLFHGEAVSIDMAYSACLSHVRGHIDAETLDEILGMLRGLQLPIYHPEFDSDMVAMAMVERIKFSQGQKIPLPTGRGRARLFNDITDDELAAALAVWTERCS